MPSERQVAAVNNSKMKTRSKVVESSYRNQCELWEDLEALKAECSPPSPDPTNWSDSEPLAEEECVLAMANLQQERDEEERTKQLLQGYYG